MPERDRRNEWTVLGAVALIAVGVWLLFGQIAGRLWVPLNAFMRFVAAIAWPLALIAAGALLLIAGRKGVVAGIDVSGKRFYRSREERLVGGVLGGLGAYLGVRPTWLRIAYVILAVLTNYGPALLVYIIAMLIVPEEPAPSAATEGWSPTSDSATGTETVQVPQPPAPPPPVPNAAERPPAPPAQD